jgi:hypothetical protein
MIFNQQVTEQQATDTRIKLLKILDGWLPYPTDYLVRKAEGWHKEYKDTNKYVSLIPNYTYQKAWESCPKKQELISYIKTLDFINVGEALKTFTEITGIIEEVKSVPELTMREICDKLGYEVKIRKESE